MAQLLKYLLELGSAGAAHAGEVAGNNHDAGLTASIDTIVKLTAALEKARAHGASSYAELGHAAEAWSELSTKATSRVLEALTAHQKQLTESVGVHERTEQAKSFATAAAIKHTAFYKAIAATAAGFQALGEFNFWSAAQDFTSAALWGTLAGTQLSSASAGGSRGAAGSRYSSGRGEKRGVRGEGEAGAMPQVMGAGAASAAGRPGGNLTVAIMGDNEAGEWLANTLNTAVETRGVQLTATRSTRSAYAQG